MGRVPLTLDDAQCQHCVIEGRRYVSRSSGSIVLHPSRLRGSINLDGRAIPGGVVVGHCAARGVLGD